MQSNNPIKKFYLPILLNFNFEGRATRRQYWMFQLFNVILISSLYIFSIIFSVLSFADNPYGYGISFFGLIAGLFFILICLVILATFVQQIALSVRRIHDVGYSGWLFLISLVPIIGGIALLVIFCLDSQVGDNLYGPNIKEDNTIDEKESPTQTTSVEDEKQNSAVSDYDKLEKIAKLKEAGFLSEEEFTEEKNKILGKNNDPQKNNEKDEAVS